MNSRQLPLDYNDENQLLLGLNHLEIAKNNFDQNKKSLIKKNTGKFYTPPEIGKPLIDSVIKYFSFLNKNTLTIIDPFCGDGRLVVWLLEAIKNKSINEIIITLWDYDKSAINQAKDNIEKRSKELNLNCKINAKNVDSFKEFLIDGYENSFDIVVTNPPWDIIKPDKLELKYLDDQSRKDYIRSLKQFSIRLINDYPTSKPNQMYGGWGVNLARIGSEIAIRLAKNEGVTGLVSPASLFADQNSTGLREWIFQNNHNKEINYFPAESRLFDGVDVASVSVVIIKGALQDGILLNCFDKNARNILQEKLEIPLTLLKSIDYKVPISFGSKSQNIAQLVRFQKLPSFNDLESPEFGGLWSGRELDETNHLLWTFPKGKYSFIKGRMVDRFVALKSSNLFIGESRIKDIPKSANYHRLVWRDVSRPTQKRRVIATIIPPNYVTGNSLGIAYFKNDTNLSKLQALLGVMSSLVFEFQVRSLLATSHISLGVLRKTHIPDFSNLKFVDQISNLVSRRIKGEENLEKDIEVLVAKSYGCSKNDFVEIVDAFPKLDEIYKEELVSSQLWLQV
jgi:Alw26I/Eco31I/Esp3I family type II restriction m6 adenine DNA methyltransferase